MIDEFREKSASVEVDGTFVKHRHAEAKRDEVVVEQSQNKGVNDTEDCPSITPFAKSSPKIYGSGNKNIQENGNENDVNQRDGQEGKSFALNRIEVRNLLLLVLSYACSFSATTLVVGCSAIVVNSVGGSDSIAPFALAMFFIGSAFISLLTSQLFARYGRKVGFLIGNVLGIVGAGMGALAVWIESPTLAIVSSLPLGSSMGIGMHLRFAALEVVPPEANAFAITLVLSGGCLAAFAGPESAEGTKDVFGNDLSYLGLFVMIAIFNLANAVFVTFVGFPLVTAEKNTYSPGERANGNDEEALTGPPELPHRHEDETTSESETRKIPLIIKRRSFLIPVSIATLCWAIMAMPMSMLRIAMNDLGYTSRQGLLAIELHFLGMYAPGFVTGKVVDRYGTSRAFLLSVVLFGGACVVNLLSDSAEDGTIATWIVGMVIFGIGWNVGFSSSTVLLSSAHFNFNRGEVTQVQAANDFFMFLLSGSAIFSTGYIYEAGGSGLDGWMTVNWTVVGFLGLMALVVAISDKTVLFPLCGWVCLKRTEKC